MKLDHLLTPHTRINLKWIKHLNIRPKPIKIIKENSKVLDIAHSNILSDMTPQARETKEKNKQMGLHQSKTFLHSKGNHQQNKNTTRRMGEHIHRYICKGLISTIYKVLFLQNSTPNNPI